MYVRLCLWGVEAFLCKRGPSPHEEEENCADHEREETVHPRSLQLLCMTPPPFFFSIKVNLNISLSLILNHHVKPNAPHNLLTISILSYNLEF